MCISISPTVKVSSYFRLHFHTIYWADPELPDHAAQTLTAARPKRRLPTGWAPSPTAALSYQLLLVTALKHKGRYETITLYAKYFQNVCWDTSPWPANVREQHLKGKRPAERRRGGSCPSASSSAQAAARRYSSN